MDNLFFVSGLVICGCVAVCWGATPECAWTWVA